jgi:Fe-S cluster assembly ATP-binding protein
MHNNSLIIKDLKSSTQNKQILKGIDLEIVRGEVHAIMGPNGAGKTTLAMSLMGHPNYVVDTKTSHVQINKKDILQKTPDERAKMGLFVSFQHPVEITGVSLLAFLRTAYKSLHPDEKISLADFKKQVADALHHVNLPEEFMQRSLNEGFSGGEKKRAEIAQLLVLKPSFAILDEIDSGLDVDSLKIVAHAVKEAVEKQNMGILLITHYQRILHFLQPDKVHVLIDGKIKTSGDISLVKRIEEEGYAAV